MALQNNAYIPDQSYPLDILGAETEGMIGYLIMQALENELPKQHRVATLLTQIEVDAQDPAFAAPSKPVGPIYDKRQADIIADSHGWTMAMDGKNYRRVVASPRPKAIPDTGIIKLLVDHGVTVICAGGGGIPVVRRSDGSLVGIEAVIDKDRSSALLAAQLGADALLMLTDVDGVYDNWQTPDQVFISHISPAEISKLDFPAGSMGPKVEAACDFVNETGGIAGIGKLVDALRMIEGKAGTLISN
ncbi:MAG: carbamate kinase [Gammaproteobacteria bacterium]